MRLLAVGLGVPVQWEGTTYLDGGGRIHTGTMAALWLMTPIEKCKMHCSWAQVCICLCTFVLHCWIRPSRFRNKHKGPHYLRHFSIQGVKEGRTAAIADPTQRYSLWTSWWMRAASFNLFCAASPMKSWTLNDIYFSRPSRGHVHLTGPEWPSVFRCIAPLIGFMLGLALLD